MFFTSNQKHWILEGITFLFILLFVYAAVSKLLTYEQFKAQLEQSPFLSSFADFLVWGVPATELLIATLLFWPKVKLEGLWSSFILMVIFTTYIIIVLNFSDSIPCSCGGVISSFSWTQHLIFNIGFIVLALFGIFLNPTINNEIVGSTKGLSFNKK
ncbi:MauE/DoxX family redox-associated membrane protein [Gillisia sp. JM1]|uniref:MauE/DoxX family redox-associated membrane protein n=1 Tax=Gillisia sp. JM1 TaxID=1283286 RepID=UPI00041A9388|nr:MauE/DoxX family redox-associated membrane protein [Gillisia sp. JM1]